MIVFTHLWQSTLCVGAAAVLVLLLRRGSATTRHAIWLLASIKFLVPFAALVAAGNAVSTVFWPSASAHLPWLDRGATLWSFETISTSVLPRSLSSNTLFVLAAIWAAGSLVIGLRRWQEWRAVSRIARSASVSESGREADALGHVLRLSARPQPIALRICAAVPAPGVFGVLRPQLLWPSGLSERLSETELAAVVAHEAGHVDRGDNLAALLQVVVETLFWFHPVVWWVSARLVDERERACDELVVRLGTEERTYAQGIVKVSGFCLHRPMTFVAGVTSMDLNARVERILRPQPAGMLAAAGRAVVGIAVTAVVMTPLAVGALGAENLAVRHQSGSDAQGDKQIYRVEKGIISPTLVKEVKPVYTAEAKQAKITGSVFLEAVVLETGVVGEVTITQSLDETYGLDEQAIIAVRQWLFKPATKDGEPVAVRVDIEMSFTLK